MWTTAPPERCSPRTAELYGRIADATDTARLLARYGQNVWGLALGRKNDPFAGSGAGGEWAAAIYTLLGTAKLNGLNPEAHLRAVLERIAEHPIKPRRGPAAVAEPIAD